jgi:hypothetical protein
MLLFFPITTPSKKKKRKEKKKKKNKEKDKNEASDYSWKFTVFHL